MAVAEEGHFLSSLSRREGGVNIAFSDSCDLCQLVSKEIECVAYCETCSKYLCKNCWNKHQESKVTCEHMIITDINLQNAKNATSTSAVTMEHCVKHPQTLVKYYCQGHDIVFCKECKVSNHSKCGSVDKISHVSKGTKKAGHFETVSDEISELNTIMNILLQEERTILGQIKHQQHKCLNDIIALRKHLNSILDKVERQMKLHLITTVKKETQTVNDNILRLDKNIKSLENSQKELNTANLHGNDHQMFVAMKQTDLAGHRKVVKIIQGEKKFDSMKFQGLPVLQDLLIKLEQVGTLNVGKISHHRFDDMAEQMTNVFVSSHAVPWSMRERKLVRVSEHNVREADDKKNCCIYGSNILPTGETLLCNYYNKKIKLLDRNCELKRSVKLTSQPWDVALVSASEAVCTLPYKQVLQFLSLSPELKPGRVVQIGKRCYGVTVYGDEMFVCCNDGYGGEGHIKVLDIRGNRLSTIGCNSDGSCMFQWPTHVAVSAASHRVFVSDSNEQCVACISRDGEIIYKHKDNQATEFPRQILLDTEDYVFVCDSENHTVQVITPDGQTHKTLLTRSDGLSSPWSMSYRESDNALIIGMYSNDNILVYRFV